jgi:hypothetical protein
VQFIYDTAILYAIAVQMEQNQGNKKNLGSSCADGVTVGTGP